MDEFARARERAEKRLARKNDGALEVHEPEMQAPPVPKAPKKRSNEITISVWIDGNEYVFSVRANITGTILAGQQNQRSMQALFLDALRSKFGSAELI